MAILSLTKVWVSHRKCLMVKRKLQYNNSLKKTIEFRNCQYLMVKTLQYNISLKKLQNSEIVIQAAYLSNPFTTVQQFLVASVQKNKFLPNNETVKIKATNLV